MIWTSLTRRRTIGAAAVAVAALLVWVRCGPLPEGLLAAAAPRSTVVVDRHGVPLYEARSAHGMRTASVDATALPPTLVAATLAAEDRRFFSHWGLDPRAVLRALRANARAGASVQGGSTITQQTVKLLLARGSAGAMRRTSRLARWRAKLTEAVIALRLEHRLSKNEILAVYLTIAPYGNEISGAERASQAYFGHPAALLTTAQAAFLASLPRRPSSFNPYRAPDEARRQQRIVIDRMERFGLIARAAAADARRDVVEIRHDAAGFGAPHLVAMVLDENRDARPERIETTLDASLQGEVEGIVRQHRDVLARHGAHNVAVVVLENATSEWLAWEGSGDYFDQAHAGTVNGPRVARQPGSALKPLTYALGFDHGLTPAAVLPDVPSNFPTAEAGVWYSPRNYDGRFRGPLRARAALAGSENVPAVALASRLGVAELLRFYQLAGISSLDRTAAHYGLGLTLGNAEVRLDELVAAYAAFARGGEWMAPTAVRAVDASATAPIRPRRRIMSPRAAFWVTDILSDPAAREYVFGRGSSLDFPFPVAAKTGTSQAYHDNWTIGYTDTITVGVWVGNFDRTPLRDSTGVTGAGPIFHAVMLAAQARVGGVGDRPGRSDAAVPSGLVRRPICSLSGEPASRVCPMTIDEWLPEPDVRLPCSWHHASQDEGLIVVWPDVYRAWATSAGMMPPSLQRWAADRTVPSESGRARRLDAVEARRDAPSLRIVNPPDGATYLIDPTLRPEFQTLALEAASPGGEAVRWSIDERFVGTSRATAPLQWTLVPGRHRIRAETARGMRADVTVLVR